MIQVSFVETVPHNLSWKTHSFNDLEDFFVHMHRREILSDGAIVGVAQLCLVAVGPREQVVYHDLVDVWFFIDATAQSIESHAKHIFFV